MDLHERVRQFTLDTLAALGLSLDVAINETPDGIRVEISGEGLQALQHIVDSAFRKQLGDQRLLIDCMDFRRGKDNELRQMAKFLAEKAKTSGIEQNIGPLNAYERRLVHLAVAEISGVTSESIGDAAVKTVTITATKK